MSFSSRISTSTPSFLRALARSAKLSGIEHVGRLVDERPRQFHALGHRLAPLPGLLGGARVGDGDVERKPLVAVLVGVGLLGLVLVELVAAEPRAEGEVSGRRGVPGLAGALEQHGRRFRLAELAGDEAAEIGEVEGLPVLSGLDADDEQALCVETGRRDQVEHGHRLAFEAGRLGPGGDRGRSEQSGRRWPCLEVAADENDEDAAFRPSKAS